MEREKKETLSNLVYRFTLSLWIAFFGGVGVCLPVQANLENETVSSEDSKKRASVNSSQGESPAGPSKKVKGRHSRSREAEGTQAPNRFESEVIIKSRYELNGQPLEVDPD